VAADVGVNCSKRPLSATVVGVVITEADPVLGFDVEVVAGVVVALDLAVVPEQLQMNARPTTTPVGKRACERRCRDCDRLA